jgi:hypothetical protein
MEDLMATEACTLPTAERPFRRAEFDTLFAASAREVVRNGDRVRIHLVGSAELREQVRDLTERESACCAFFTFGIEGGDDDLTLAISVPLQRRAFLDALAARAEGGSA